MIITNYFVEWLKAEAYLANTTYASMLKQFETSKTLQNKWKAYKKTLPLSKPIQTPTQLFTYRNIPIEIANRLVIPPTNEDVIEMNELKKSNQYTPNWAVVDRWVIPPEFRTNLSQILLNRKEYIKSQEPSKSPIEETIATTLPSSSSKKKKEKEKTIETYEKKYKFKNTDLVWKDGKFYFQTPITNYFTKIGADWDDITDYVKLLRASGITQPDTSTKDADKIAKKWEKKLETMYEKEKEKAQSSSSVVATPEKEIEGDGFRVIQMEGQGLKFNIGKGVLLRNLNKHIHHYNTLDTPLDNKQQMILKHLQTKRDDLRKTFF
jgi:hypothetical protein